MRKKHIGDVSGSQWFSSDASGDSKEKEYTDQRKKGKLWTREVNGMHSELYFMIKTPRAYGGPLQKGI